MDDRNWTCPDAPFLGADFRFPIHPSDGFLIFGTKRWPALDIPEVLVAAYSIKSLALRDGISPNENG